MPPVRIARLRIGFTALNRRKHDGIFERFNVFRKGPLKNISRTVDIVLPGHSGEWTLFKVRLINIIRVLHPTPPPFRLFSHRLNLIIKRAHYKARNHLLTQNVQLKESITLLAFNQDIEIQILPRSVLLIADSLPIGNQQVFCGPYRIEKPRHRIRNRQIQICSPLNGEIQKAQMAEECCRLSQLRLARLSGRAER
jgi:hypothetical protein